MVTAIYYVVLEFAIIRMVTRKGWRVSLQDTIHIQRSSVYRQVYGTVRNGVVIGQGNKLYPAARNRTCGNCKHEVVDLYVFRTIQHKNTWFAYWRGRNGIAGAFKSHGVGS